jgi:hypothetical protein
VVPADDEGDARVGPEVAVLARVGRGVEDDLEIVRDREADHGRLGAPPGAIDACTASLWRRREAMSSAPGIRAVYHGPFAARPSGPNPDAQQP